MLKKLQLPKNLRQGSVVEIRWYDHNSRTGSWKDPADSLNQEPFVCESVGYWMGINKKSNTAVLALNHGITNDTVADLIYIMYPSIISLKKIR